MDKIFEIGSKRFVLDQNKAEAAFAAKAVINGRETMAFNLLPLKYQWAYDLYQMMKANHWEPEDIPMGKDIEQWQSDTELSDTRPHRCRGPIRSGRLPCQPTRYSWRP